jgi:hypothetical protein
VAAGRPCRLGDVRSAVYLGSPYVTGHRRDDGHRLGSNHREVSEVELDYALLADAAQVAQGKTYILGGGVTTTGG